MAKVPKWTMATLPYDITVDPLKISDDVLPPKIKFITANGDYDVSLFTLAKVNIVVMHSTIHVRNNSSYTLTCESVTTTGRTTTKTVSPGAQVNVYGLLDADGHIDNYPFRISVPANTSIKGVGGTLTKVTDGTNPTIYTCIVNKPSGNTEVTVTITDL